MESRRNPFAVLTADAASLSSTEDQVSVLRIRLVSFR